MIRTETQLTAIIAGALAIMAVAFAPAAATITSNIDTTSSFAWGENVGWINFRGQGTGDTVTPPPVIGTNGFMGYAWGENIGWINLGDGTNADPNAFGVVVDDATGALSGYAWAENVGWINFGTNFTAVPVNDRPAVDLATGEFSGYAWGENIGWINLDGSSIDPAAQVVAAAPTASQIAAGLVAHTPVPLFSDRQPDGVVDAADVATRVNDGAP